MYVWVCNDMVQTLVGNVVMNKNMASDDSSSNDYESSDSDSDSSSSSLPFSSPNVEDFPPPNEPPIIEGRMAC